MISIWDKYRDEIKILHCDWCDKWSPDMYRFEDELVCKDCLCNEEYEDPEHGLTLEERNQ